jgi:uncharacterized protein (DUF2147 family)
VAVEVIMRSIPCLWVATFLLPGLALAAEPTGEWRVANGAANIRIDDCNGALWGVISWEQQPGLDSHNPNPSERTRPMLGVPILKAMRPTKPGLWEGEVYNAQNGQTYSSRIGLTAPDVLRIEGCVLGGLICGGESWSRVKTAEIAPTTPPAAAPSASATTSASRPPAPPPPPATRAARPAPGTPPAPPPAALTACSSIPDGAGATHKGGLK